MKFARIKIVKLYKGGIVKKLFLTLLLSLGFISSLSAQELDFIAVATQGKFNENSLGVKALSDEEMSKVVGGRVTPLTLWRITPVMTSYAWLVDGSDLGYSLNAEIRTLIDVNSEVLIFARRHYYNQVQVSWLIAYNPYTGYSRDLSFISASTRIFQHLDQTTPDKFQRW